MTAKPRTLAGIEILDWLPSQALSTLEARCRWSDYDADEQIIDQGSDNRDVYFVVDGAVRIVNFSTSGREIAYANLERGSYFGELAAIDGQPRSASAVAVRPTVLASLSGEVFLDLLFERPPLALKVMRKLCDVIRISDDRIMDLSTLRAVQRVYIEVLRLAKPQPNGALLIEQLPNHSDIASLASTTRETVARVLSELTAGHVIEKHGRKLLIKSPDRLRKLAESAVEGE